MIELIYCAILSTLVLGSDAVWHQVWADEFNGTEISETDWTHQTGCTGFGNNELECYTAKRPENARLENGHLVIDVKVEEFQKKHFTSAKLTTKNAWAYGKFEIRAKLPKGKNLWPAIWMMPKDNAYGTWAASGEIDIMEARGERPTIAMGTLHYGGKWPNNIHHGSGEKTFGDLTADFHTFGLEWEEKEMRWYVNGTEYYKADIDKMMWSGKGTNPYTKNGQPFDKPFYLILNVAVGGNFFPTSTFGPHITPVEAKQWAKPSMEIDFVRVFEWK